MAFRMLHFVLQRRKLILWVTLVFFAAGIASALFTTGVYESQALLMPPLEEGGEGLLAAWMAQLNLPAMVAPMAAGTATASVLADIVRSRRLAEMIVTSLDLKERYGVGTMDDAVETLGGLTKVTTSTTGLITIRVRDEEPEYAMRIARSYIAGLDSLNRFLQFSRAEQTMVFIEGQIAKYRGRLEALREEIALFQKTNGMIDFEEQVRGAIDVAATLKVRTVIAGIELDLLKEFARKDVGELQRKQAEYENLTIQLARIMEGDTSEAVFVPLRRLPDLYQQYASLQRDLAVNERVYSFLSERYEESGIERARTTPSVQVVDEPNLPQKPSGFPRWGIALVVTAVGFLWITGLLAWWAWMTTRHRSAEEEHAFEEVRDLARGDILRLKRFLRL